jgi:hypothetical protein
MGPDGKMQPIQMITVHTPSPNGQKPVQVAVPANMPFSVNLRPGGGPPIVTVLGPMGRGGLPMFPMVTNQFRNG